MDRTFSEECWRTILELSEQVAALPASEREAYLAATAVESHIQTEVLEVASQFREDLPHSGSGDSLLGTTIGRFLITGVLGSGGMGDVYSALDTELDRPVALKLLRPEVLGWRDVHQRFIREAQTASALSHPNIVTIYEIVRTDAVTAIVMELVEGRPLRALCNDQNNAMRRVLEIGEQIASALAAAHRRGIVHRDVKPENVLVQAEDRVKVLDFGLARQTVSSGGVSSLYAAGTLRYFSPEQARGEPPGPASDVFSLGLVLQELTTARHPFGGDSPFETVHSILNGSPEHVKPDQRIPRAFCMLLETMLSKDPVQRPSAGEVAHALSGMQRMAISPGSADPKRSRWRLVAVAISLAMLIAFGAALRRRLRPISEFDFGDLHIKPLTSQPGWESDPALSPDGKYIAFTWDDHPENPQLYVMRVKGAEPFKLTEISARHIGALAWSPDGKRIAYKIQLRGTSGGEIRTLSPSGGSESVVTTLRNANTSSALDWSPDGKKLAFSDSPPGSTQFALYVYNLETGEKLKVTTPPPGTWGDWSPAFSPDGRTLAFKRVSDFWLDEIYLMPAGGGHARQLTSVKAGIWGHAWMSDGKSLLISCQRGSTLFGIWRFPLMDPLHPERVQEGAGDLITPTTARRGNTIAWVNQIWDSNIYRTSTAGSTPPEKLIASTRRDQNPAVSSDGRIAFVSDRSSSREIWIAAHDGTHQTQVTEFRGPQIDNLMWSPDGHFLAFESRLHGQTGVFIMECLPGRFFCEKPKEVVSHSSAPAWSADGKAIYFASARSGVEQIWRHPLYGGEDRRMTSKEAAFSRETLDGKWLYFSGNEAETIFRTPTRAPASGTNPAVERAIEKSIPAMPLGWDMGPTDVVFFELPARRQRWAIRAASIVSGRDRFVGEWGDAYVGADGMVLSVSRDGKWVYYPRLDSAGANVLVAESVR